MAVTAGGGACLALALLLAGVAAAAGRFMPLDPLGSRLGFELSTRWGMTLEGLFPRFDGGVRVLEGGLHQVSLRMFTSDVQIDGHPRYTEWARGPMFFESSRWPVVVFISEPYDPAVLVHGGPLAGDLTVRGIRRPKTLQVLPSECARPALDCDVVATGTIRRSDYEMDTWKLAVNDRVVFVLRARLQEHASP